MNEYGYDWTALLTAGDFLLSKFLRQVEQSGVERAARNLRKQGVPLDSALTMLMAVPK